MTEAEWLAATDLADVQAAALVNLPGPRKLRLFGCACARAFLWTPLAWAPVIALCERYADGLAPHEAVEEVLRRAEVPEGPREEAVPVSRVHELLELIVAPEPATGWKAPLRAGELPYIQKWAGDVLDIAWEALNRTYRFGKVARGRLRDEDLTNLLRDIVGNPFRPQPAIDPAWHAWNGGTIPQIARATYDERLFADLPILGDALEEAGCTSTELLGHLRGPGPHARGSWAIDLLLGKE
jgi:hypothetical protein